MKSIFTGIVLISSLVFSSLLFGQSPEKFSYQAIVRDASDNLVQNQNIGIQISILQGSSSGSSVYTERHFPTTNTNGLATIQIGTGTVILGSFNAIDWANGSYFINSEIDLNGGANYTISGVSELLSVPYALNAPPSGWRLTGNSGTDMDNFIGTTDETPLNIRTNDTLRIRVTTKGQLEFHNTGGSIFIGKGAGENDDLDNNLNTFVGYYSGRSNTTGNASTAIGNRSLNSNTTGFSNSSYGYQSSYSNTIGYRNTSIGFQALFSNTTGYHNHSSGYKSLYNNNTGNHNTALGFVSGSQGQNYYNRTSIGYNAQNTTSNQIRLGNSSVSSIGGYASWSNVSDRRFKTNIQENITGLDFIMKLRPVTYHLDMDAIATYHNTPDSLRLAESEDLKAAEVQSGFIAQEVEKAAQSVGFDFSGVDAPKNESDHYSLRYAEFVVPLVKGMQEQQELIKIQQEEIDELKKSMARLLILLENTPK